jgi:Carbohydrate binding module (family 6)
MVAGKYRDAYAKTEAESFDAQVGTVTEAGHVGYLGTGDYLKYDLDFDTGAKSLALTLAVETSGGKIELRIDSPTAPAGLVASHTVTATGGWGTYAGQVLNFDAGQTAKLTGKHSLYLVFVGVFGDIANIDALQFSKTGANNPPPPPPMGDAPPQFLSAQRVADAMAMGPNGDSWIGWGYPANRYGALNSVGARLKHASNVANYCNISPYQELLATLIIQWLTVGFMNPSVPAGHNVAIEMVPMPLQGRIKPSYGGPNWVTLSAPTGGVVSGLIGGSGVSYGVSGEVKNSGRITRIPDNAILHPWAVVDASGSVDAQITSNVSSNPSDPRAESKVDDIANAWWVRLVPYDASQPIGDITSNPILAVAAADPYANRPRTGLSNDGQCTAGIAATNPMRLTTSWQQISWHTSLDAPDKHTDGEGSGITNAEFLRLPPPGYQ